MAREELSRVLNAQERAEFAYHWGFFARLAQLPPKGEWRIWLILAGRGFGKTRAGSEWVRSIAEGNSQARIALVSSSLAEARSVMVEGESGIIACCPPERRPVFEPSLRRLRFPNGAQAQLFSAAEPELLRGPQHTHACRAEFCGPGCTLSALGLTSVQEVSQIDFDANRVSFGDLSYDLYIDGKLRFLSGPQTGLTFGIVSADPQGLILDRALSEGTQLGTRAELLEGCDHTLATCAGRFSNAANFRGEPFLPGNDLLSRYGKPTE